MLASIVEDFARVEDCEVVTTLDERLIDRSLPARDVVRTRGDDAPTFRQLAAESDWTLVVAPEFDHILFDRTRWVEECGGRLLGPTSLSVSITADKLTCERQLREAAVPTPQSLCVSLEELRVRRRRDFHVSYVLKPRDGAGSQCIFLVRDRETLIDVIDTWTTENGPATALVQPFVPGLAVSIALLVGPTETTPLVPARQILSDDGRLRYLGGELPLPLELAERARHLGLRACGAIPGLRGYVGVDLVLGDRNADDVVIEINPRLTTSYVGLRAYCRANLAALMIACVSGSTLPPIRWQRGRICFRADGSLA